MSYGALLVAAAAIPGGCVKARPAEWGVVERAAVAKADQNREDSMPDFVFRSQAGQAKKFSESRGDVTILVFPSDESWPDCGQCAQLQNLAYRLSRAHSDVTVVSVFVPKDSCEQRQSQLKRCEIRGYADLIALCDASGHVRDLYGPGAEGRFFIVDANGRRVGTGDLADLDGIENCARKAVYQHETACKLSGSQGIDWPY